MLNSSDEPSSTRWEHNSDLGCQTQSFVVGICQTAATLGSYNLTKEEDSVSSKEMISASRTIKACEDSFPVSLSFQANAS